MNNNQYVVYHLHSDLSLLDSCTKYQDYIDKAVELGQKAICFTEHGNIYNWVNKKIACDKAGIKYLHGCEVYLTENLLPKIRDNYHTILIAKNMNGLKEINKLISISNRDDHFYFKPRISFEEFLNISDNVIKISACLASPLNKLREKNESLLKKYDYYEIQPHINSEEQKEYNKFLYSMSLKYNKPLIAGTETHSLNKYKAECRSILQLAKGIEFTNEDDFDLTYKSFEELVDMFKQQNSLDENIYMEAINNTNIMAASTEEIILDTSFKYPKVSDNDELSIKEEVYKSLEQKIKNGIIKESQRDIFVKNIEEELRVFKIVGMSGFMLFMSQHNRWCSENNIPIGFGRGSCCGSYVAYVLDIIDVNPLKWKTVFSRFCNEDRKEIGDIDEDYAPKDREKVYNHMIEKFGDDYTDYILAIGTVSDKATIDEIGRALSRKFPNNKLFSLSSIADIKEEYESNQEETKLKYPEIFYYFDGILNTSISQSIHPAGMVVSPISLSDNYGETYREGKKLLQIDMEGVHEVSLVKYDILGLKNVGIIKDACKYANIPYPKSNEINWEDNKVWQDMVTSPYGIFQFESDFAFTLLKQFMPTNIFDMSLVTAALRPAGASYRNELMERKIHKNPSAIIDDMLKDNLGFLIYQEDTIKFLKDICGLSGSEADNIRRAIGRKQKDRLDKAMPSILEGYCQKSNQPRNVAEQEAKEFLQIIEDSADYQFGYNHSIAYCMIGYVCAYLRYYYPLEFICSYLNNADTEKDIANGTDLAKIKKIKILPIRFGVSRAKYSFDKKTNSIYKGIGSIKFLNEKVAEELFKLSENKYESFTDLLLDIKNKTSINSRQLDILIKLDFFSMFGNCKELLNIVDIVNFFKFGETKTIKKEKLEGSYILNFIDKYATDKGAKGNKLKNYNILDCKSILIECENYIKSLNIEDMDLRNKIMNQQEYLGYISATTKEEDRPILFVKEVKTLKRKSDKKQFGYSIFTQSIGSGITSRFTLLNRDAKEYGELHKNDIIKCLDYEIKNSYFNLKKFQKI